MLALAAQYSLVITAIYLLFQQGNLLSFIRVFYANMFDDIFGKIASRFIQKPLWDCIFCMSSVWSCILILPFHWHNISFLFFAKLVMMIAGINAIIDKYLNYDQGKP